ncbi:hypothetical protein TSUD_58930 [Trifolium subterraneum]|uniref:Uncharacterized protein n=1 Tax=Trifolium subterraneum TaxID=3900 RepID=A0A2Z6NHD3_TRISU|nr:hypothetical protein TSUD_58930 [Trifolium subterraneum]
MTKNENVEILKNHDSGFFAWGAAVFALDEKHTQGRSSLLDFLPKAKIFRPRQKRARTGAVFFAVLLDERTPPCTLFEALSHQPHLASPK